MSAETNTPHDRPNAVELVDIVAEFLRDEILEHVDGQLAFHVRVAINALGIVDRELRFGPDHAAAHSDRLAVLDCVDDTELAERIRSGHLDDRYAEVAQVVRALTWEKISVMNPKYVNPYNTPDARED